MDWQSENTVATDYLAPEIGEGSGHRTGQQIDPQDSGQPHTMARAVARRLLPACVAAPAVLWWALYFGQQSGWYEPETCFVLFVFSVAAVFGLIVCLNLRQLSRMDSQRAATEERFRLAKEAAEAANRFKSAFFANISHEIRTPLTAINGFAELMIDPSRTHEERIADARIIQRNGEHLLNLINDILDLSKIEAGKMTVERIICSPATLVGEVLAMLRRRAEVKGLTLQAGFDGQIPSGIRTDPTRLRQILINLVSNAIKFTSEGGVRVAMSLRPCAKEDESLLELKISDTGIGIPQDRLAMLFEPFVQADVTMTRQFGGSGLGLAISRHFCRALGGDVTVTSEPGRGSTFTVTVETGSLAEVPMLEDPQQAMQLQDASAGPQVRIKGSILVAEDGIDNQALIATRLRQTGLTVEIAPNGQIACDKALTAIQEEKPFDLILMDVQMPEMDGYTATLKLRGGGYRGPIIALTANAMERDRKKCLNAGCNDFVTKPIDLERLFNAIGRYLPVERAAAARLVGTPDSAPGASGGDKVEEFYKALPGELADIEETIDREDRVRLRELVQLVLGKATAAGLKDVAVETVKLLQMAEVEPSWAVVRESVRNFAREAQSEAALKAA